MALRLGGKAFGGASWLAVLVSPLAGVFPILAPLAAATHSRLEWRLG